MVCLLLAVCFVPQNRVDPDALIMQDFDKRVAAYVNLAKSLARDLPANKPTAEPQKILDHQHELAAKIRAARAKSVPGEIFTADIQKEFRRLLGFATEGKNDAQIKKSLARSEPVNIVLHVNESYPPHVPLQSTPPTILMNLPHLPPELEYRIVGHTLVLRDPNANLVVDLMPNVLP